MLHVLLELCKVLPLPLPEIPEPAPSIITTRGSNWGIRVFPAIKLTAICQVRKYCGLSLKINTHETQHGAQRSWVHFVCICFRVCGQPKPKDPQLELYVWLLHYLWRYRSSGISCLYLWPLLCYHQVHGIIK